MVSNSSRNALDQRTGPGNALWKFDPVAARKRKDIRCNKEFVLLAGYKAAGAVACCLDELHVYNPKISQRPLTRVIIRSNG